MMKHVTVGKAIDWQQWQLDQAVRSVRMQVDKDGDLYALPVVVIDPTGSKVAATPKRVTATYYSTLASGIQDVWVPPLGLDAHVQGFMIDFVNSTRAASGYTTIIFMDRGAPLAWFTTYPWMEITAAFRPPTVITFPESGIRCTNGVQVVVSAGLIGTVLLQLWGYDA